MHELRLDFGEQKTAALIEVGRAAALTLGDFLARFPARAAAPIPAAWLAQPLGAFRVIPVSLGAGEPALLPHPTAPSPSGGEGELGHGAQKLAPPSPAQGEGGRGVRASSPAPSPPR